MSFWFFTIFIFLHESDGDGGGHALFSAPAQTAIEPTVVNVVSWLKLLIETTGAIIIAAGVVLAFVEFLKVLSKAQPEGYTKVRLLLARYLALALEFQLGADILSTAITPSLDQILTLGAIAVIRTALNYFLTREMQEERQTTEAEKRIDADA